MANKQIETVKNFRARVFAATLMTLESMRVEFLNDGDCLPGPIVARRGPAYVCDNENEYVLSFVGVNPMNVHYTWTSRSHSSGYTMDDAGVYPSCGCRANCTIIPARVFELAMMDLDDEWGITHRDFSDADAAYAAQKYEGIEDQDDIPEYDCGCEEVQ